jgi:crotonobetaine/carnitine-CoA ligase
LPVLLEEQGRRLGEKPVLRLGAEELSFTAVRGLAARSAGRLVSCGIRPGDRVAVMCGNRRELLEIVLGCSWCGAIAVPINTASRGAQLEHILANSGARTIAVEPSLAHALEPIARPETLETVWLLTGDADPEAAGIGGSLFPELGEEAPMGDLEPSDPAAILYTSGTTGPSKGVLCSHAHLFSWAVQLGRMLETTADDVHYTTLPLFHSNALHAFVHALTAGATIVVGARFSASRYMQEVCESRATVAYLLGAMVHILAKQPPSSYDREHRVRVALAPATPAHLFDSIRERFGFQLLDAYGSTETNAVIGGPIDEQRPGTMGRIWPGFEARVVDEYDEEVADGSVGELVLRPDAPFSFSSGYFEMPEKTVEAWRNLWFHTGDRVIREPDGHYRFVDRAKDAIRRRGENVSSWEVEQAVQTHPDVVTAAAVGVPSDLAEEEVMVFVVLQDGRAPDPAALIGHLESRLAYFAIPRYVEFVASLPLTDSGKVSKYALRERGVGSETWDREAAGIELRR